MSHNHTHKAPKTLFALIIAIIINLGIVVFEIVFGILSHSLSLISDAVHNLTDISSMVLGYFAEKISMRPADSKRTYGYKKVEFIAAFTNTLILLVATMYILYEGVIRLSNPEHVLSWQMLVVGSVAFFGNTVATWILAKGSKENTNMKAVWLHSLQDALLSLGVIFGAVVIYFTQWDIVDPILSIVISIVLLKSIYSLLQETFNALVDSVPKNINFEEIRQSLSKIDGVKDIGDLHIWLAASRMPILSVHLQIKNKDDLETIFDEVKRLLRDKYDIEHTTIQIIPQTLKTKNECLYCN